MPVIDKNTDTIKDASEGDVIQEPSLRLVKSGKGGKKRSIEGTLMLDDGKTPINIKIDSDTQTRASSQLRIVLNSRGLSGLRSGNNPDHSEVKRIAAFYPGLKRSEVASNIAEDVATIAQQLNVALIFANAMGIFEVESNTVKCALELPEPENEDFALTDSTEAALPMMNIHVQNPYERIIAMTMRLLNKNPEFTRTLLDALSQNSLEQRDEAGFRT